MSSARISLYDHNNDQDETTASVKGLPDPWLDINCGKVDLIVFGSLGELQQFAAKVTAAVRNGVDESNGR